MDTMKKKLVFVTNNKHKLAEIYAMLNNKIQISSLKDINCDVNIPETGNTIAENALLKAEYVYKNYQLNCFADDTGLEIEAIDGAPGVYSARYAGIDQNSEANVKKVLAELKGKKNRDAQFRTVISLIIDGKETLFEGIIKGKIIEEKRGNSGFGYDPIFMPDGYDKTFAELGEEIKNKISHRALAIKQLCKFLNDLK
jgi:XTP/dITP diphosphohydrolase